MTTDAKPLTDAEEAAVRDVLEARRDLAQVRGVLERVECISADGFAEVREALDRCEEELRALVVTADLSEAVALERLARVANGGAA